jgi:hypothetical protein
MPRRMGDLLAERTAAQMVGRCGELAALRETLEPDGVPITHLHGIGGIGKTTLLAAFNSIARATGAVVVSLDSRVIEPTSRGFLHELGAATGATQTAVDEITGHLGSLGDRVVLVVDTYELLRLIDTWLRQDFVPSLPENVRLIMAGREAPASAWLTIPGARNLVQSIALDSLPEEDAIDLLRRNGVDPPDAARLNRFACGHPLALELAAAAVRHHSALIPEDAAIPQVVAELSWLYLQDVDNSTTRQALEAASVVRRTTLPLLHAMLPGTAPQDAFDRLRALPFVDLQRDGLHLHDTVQQALAAQLKAADPVRYRACRRAAWECLRSEVRQVGHSELWRYTADMLYLVENPVIREAFFPSTGYSLVFEPSRPDDDVALRHIITTTEGPEAAGHLVRLWQEAPQTFRVARDRDGSVAGFYCMFLCDDVERDVLERDPIVSRWLDHLEASPTHGQLALFARRWLSRECGELPSSVQAAAWLDIKRAYMELRPRLGRVYMTVVDVETYGEAAVRLKFNLLPEANTVLDGHTYYTAVNEFGPSSIDGWLARLVGDELGIDTGDDVLDVHARELALDGQRVPLTRLEFETLRYLHEREGMAIRRDELLDNVWGDTYAGGSNVIDVVVLSLRKKLGSRAACLQTVRGTGYRFRRP